MTKESYILIMASIDVDVKEAEKNPQPGTESEISLGRCNQSLFSAIYSYLSCLILLEHKAPAVT